MSETPTWLKEWKKLHNGQTWGFVAFRTALYGDQSQWRPGAPLLLAVSVIEDLAPGEGKDEWERFKPVFKVMAETVATGLWWILESGMTDLRKVTVSVKSSNELGDTGWIDRGDLEEEMFWTYGPSPASLRRRMRLRGFPSLNEM